LRLVDAERASIGPAIFPSPEKNGEPVGGIRVEKRCGWVESEGGPEEEDGRCDGRRQGPERLDIFE
jgi:hypothetical protein